MNDSSAIAESTKTVLGAGLQTPPKGPTEGLLFDFQHG